MCWNSVKKRNQEKKLLTDWLAENAKCRIWMNNASAVIINLCIVVVVFVSYQYFKEKKKQNLRTKLKPNPSKPLVFGHIRDLTRQNYVY